VGHLDRRSVVNGNIFNSKGVIFNSKGVRVVVVMDDVVFGLKGQKLYDLKGSNIYKLNGDLVGHLSMRAARRSVWTKRPTGRSRKVRRGLLIRRNAKAAGRRTGPTSLIVATNSA
jgi:hypothetical protein